MSNNCTVTVFTAHGNIKAVYVCRAISIKGTNIVITMDHPLTGEVIEFTIGYDAYLGDTVEIA